MATTREQKAAEFWAQKRAVTQQLGPELEPDPRPVADMAAETGLDPEPAPPPNGHSPERSLKQQSRAVQARWAGEAASEQDLRTFFTSLDLPRAFKLYAQCRSNLEIMGKILNDRSNVPEVQCCKTCGLSFADMQRRSRKNDWFLNRPHYHQGDRNIIDVDHFCSAACVSLENNKTQGVYGMADRGMLASDNPQNHPREFPGQRSLTDHDRSRLKQGQ
jgi:hypothetical protein